MGDLPGRRDHLVREIVERDERVLALAGDGAPRRRARGCLLAARVRQLVDALAGLGRGLADEFLVLELLQRRVDRARARPPHAAGPLGELLDDLVAVHGLLGEQREDRGADVAASCAAAERIARAAVTMAPPALPGAAHDRVCGRRPADGRPPIANAVMRIPFVRACISRYIVTHRELGVALA